MVKLLEQIGDLSLSELSERIRAQNSTVTGIIDRMEREGLVTRERSKEDRRVVYIRLTTKDGPAFELADVSQVDILKTTASPASAGFLKLEGSTSSGIRIHSGPGPEPGVILGKGVAADAVTVK